MSGVLVVDDDAPLLRALRGALSRADYEVHTAPDGARALEVTATAAPDVVVLDLGLPDGDGVSVLSTLRAWSDVPVLVLTGASDPARMVAAFDAGADDFLRKPFGLEELLARVRALLRRPRSGEPEAAVRRFGDLEVDLASTTLTRAGERVHLTPTEWRILAALVGNPGKLLTHRWLLVEVWDEGYGDETRAALRAHVRTLRSKLRDDATAPRFLATESGAGYRWIAEESPSADPGPLPAAPSGGAGDLVHDTNNALTAARLALALARGRVGRLEAEQQLTDGSATTVLEPLDEVAALLERVGRHVVELGSAATAHPGPDPGPDPD